MKNRFLHLRLQISIRDMAKFFITIILLLFITVNSFATSYHVTVDGLAEGNGSEDEPWDIVTALAHPNVVQPGDTIWLHGGIYKGSFTSTLNGTAIANIIVRQYPNEKVILDGKTGSNHDSVLEVNGSYTTFWGFTITNSETIRVSQEPGSNPSDIPHRGGLVIKAHHSKFINLVIYNHNSSGVGLWKPAENSELYGCIIYHNGWQGPDRGHGHGLYVQNENGTKIIKDNIIFNGMSYGVHGYTEGGSIQGFHFEGNTFFNNGIISKDSKLKANVLIGGLQPSDRVTFISNYSFHDLSKGGQNIELGYYSDNENMVCENNYICGGYLPLKVTKWKSITLYGNTIYGRRELVSLDLPNGVSSSSYHWDNNTYYQGNDITPMDKLTYDQWKQTYSVDANSQYLPNPPTGSDVFVRPNQYEPGRSHIVIYNWGLKNSVNVDLASVLPIGSEYKIFDVENLDSEAILAGKYEGGTMEIPMNLTAVCPPSGDLTCSLKHSGLEFGAYLLTSTPPKHTSTDYLASQAKKNNLNIENISSEIKTNK